MRQALAFLGLLALCGYMVANVHAGGLPQYQGIDMPTPMGWETERVGNRSFAIDRRLVGPGGAVVLVHARIATAADEVAMRHSDRGNDVPSLPGWTKEIERFKGGYVVIYERGDMVRAVAALHVKDRRGASFVTFAGSWPSSVHLLVAFAANRVLDDIKNR